MSPATAADLRQIQALAPSRAADALAGASNEYAKPKQTAITRGRNASLDASEKYHVRHTKPPVRKTTPAQRAAAAAAIFVGELGGLSAAPISWLLVRMTGADGADEGSLPSVIVVNPDEPELDEPPPVPVVNDHTGPVVEPLVLVATICQKYVVLLARLAGV